MEFWPKTQRLWYGRYSRSSGSFHVRWINNAWWPVVEWKRDGVVSECPAVDNVNEISWLVDSVNKAKRFLGGNPGGSFMIDEYGEVIVPSNAGGDICRALVGYIDLTKPFCFQDPFDNNVFDLSVSRMGNGNMLDIPYVGMRFKLNAAMQICQEYQTPLGTLDIFPRVQDQGLIAQLNNLGGGGCRFVVNPYGIVARKILCGNAWIPVYVGRINRDLWF